MGWKVEKRPILTKGVNAATSLTPSTTPQSLDGDFVAQDNIKAGGTLDLPVESLTGTDAAQTVSADGVSFITYGTSGISNDFLLPAPPVAGALKFIHVINNTTSVELNFNTGTTAAANNIFGTTFNTITISAASTGSPGGTPAGTATLVLVGASTAQWAVFPGSTFNWDFAGSTGSTSQA